MDEGFVIMQIGDRQLEAAYEGAIVPALRACGLAARRVDRHNRGGLLHSEIIGFLEGAEIIVADLTNERPNCYLEVGYAYGAGRATNVVLTARDDHNPDSARYRPGGPKVHFDLAGYDILFWSPADLEGFRSELVKRIARRRLLLGGG